MKYAMDVKVNIKPGFSNLVHTDWWEGSCRGDFRQVFRYYEEIPEDQEIWAEARELLEGAVKTDIEEQYLRNDLRYFHGGRKVMEQYDRNAFTTPCKELCASRLPQKYKCVPCMTHSLNKDDRIPSACEEDLEGACREAVKHFISLTGSAGRGGDFAPTYSFCHDISKIETGAGE